MAALLLPFGKDRKVRTLVQGVNPEARLHILDLFGIISHAYALGHFSIHVYH